MRKVTSKGIAGRLRFEANRKHWPDESMHRLLHRAADELDQLRSENIQLRADVGGGDTAISQLEQAVMHGEDEIKRLKIEIVKQVRQSQFVHDTSVYEWLDQVRGELLIQESESDDESKWI